MALCSSSSSSSLSSPSPFQHLLCKSTFPLTASLTLLLSPCTARNQKIFAENDSRSRESPILKKLLEISKLNKEKNEKAIQDKYCLRGAEWGVGDCSTYGMTDEEKDKFITMLKKKKKTGVE